MQRIATVRMLLAILGIVFLLANPAGICAGTMGSQSPSHPCCPKPAGDLAKAPCVCIDRQPAAPVLPSLTEQASADAVAPAPALVAALPVYAPEIADFEAPSPGPHSILVSIHQFLL